MRSWTSLGATVLLVTGVPSGLAQQSAPRPGIPTAAASVTIPADQGVLHGRIFDDRSGRPIEHALVRASGPGGEQMARTDVDGRYKLSELVPGSYRVYASAAGHAEWQYGQLVATQSGEAVQVYPGQATQRINIRLDRASAVSGRIFTAAGDPFPRVEVKLLGNRHFRGRTLRSLPVAYAQTDEQGMFRFDGLQPGRYHVRAQTGRLTQPSAPASEQVYTATLFPNATSLDAAQPLLVAAGQEVVGIDFALAMVETFTVAGAVANATGPFFEQPLVSVTPAGTLKPVQEVPVAADGSFQISGLVPGDYDLRVADAASRVPVDAVPGTALTVESDVKDLVLVAPPVARLTGRIVADGTRPLPFDPTTLQLMMTIRPGGGRQLTLSVGAVVRPDGTFAVDGVVGPTTLQVGGLPPGWFVRAVQSGGSDITYAATDFGGGHHDVKIILADEPAPLTDLAGHVTDRNGDAVSDCTVVVFAENRDLWVYPSRYVQGIRAAADGSFHVPALLPGDYLAVAVESPTPVEWQNPDVLERLWFRATSFRLAEGEHQRLDLRLEKFRGGLQP